MVSQAEESNDVVHNEMESKIKSLQLDNQHLRCDVIELRSHPQVLTIELLNDQDVLQFYTALPNWTVFKAVFDLVSPSLPVSPCGVLGSIR